MNIIDLKAGQISGLCDMHNVRQLFLFGSFSKGNETPKSDVDFLVQFMPGDITIYFDNYITFREKLEKLLGRKVDLVENQSIRNPIFRKVIDREKKLVYERTDL